MPYDYVLQASKNISSYYACHDLMEIVTLSNLVALAVEISGLNFEGDDAHLTETAFTEVVKGIFDRINLLGKWEKKGKRKYEIKKCMQ